MSYSGPEYEYSIKVISPGHMDDTLPWHHKNFDNSAKRNWMNFQKPNPCHNLPKKGKALVYVQRWRRFVWAIEYEEVVKKEDYRKILLDPHGKDAFICDDWRYIRPFRFLAKMDFDKPNYTAIPTLFQLGIDWTPKQTVGGVHKSNKEFFSQVLKKMPWDFQVGRKSGPKYLSLGSKMDSLYQRISNLSDDSSERDCEDAVKVFLEGIGHAKLKFRHGHIDLLASSAKGSPVAVIEVKRMGGLDKAPDIDSARKQGCRYAAELKGRVNQVIVSDGDRYYVFDRSLGRNFDKQFKGWFQLSRLTESGKRILEQIRPK